MQNLLAIYYDIKVDATIEINGRIAYTNDEYVYFNTTAANKEVIHMEQASLAYYLVEKGYNQVAYPIQNINSQWITQINGEKQMIMRLNKLKTDRNDVHGKVLALFHYVNRSYEYQPQYISSYGQWKELWIDKLTYYEEKIETEAQENKHDYYKLLMDVLPYLIGISENAIQYVQTSEQEQRYNEGDQGTIAFQRYEANLNDSFILPENLVYDHRVRDISEYIRAQLFLDSDLYLDEITMFLSDYEHVYPLSPLSWRLLYARLLFPIQIFDLIEAGFEKSDLKEHYKQLKKALIKQETYEHRLSMLFKTINHNQKKLDIPVISWLSNQVL